MHSAVGWAMPNASALRGRDLERRLQRPRHLARTLAQGVLELAQLRPHGRYRSRLYRAVGLDQLLPERRERSAAALRASRLSGDHWLAEALVQVVDQEPGTPVGHVEQAAGLRDRAGPPDRLKQPDLARAQSPLGAEIDPHRQPNVAHGATPRCRMAKTLARPLADWLGLSRCPCGRRLHGCEPREQAGEACGAQRQIALFHQPARPLHRSGGVMADAVDREQHNVGAADQALNERGVVLEAAIVMQKAAVRALHQTLELRNLMAAAADIENAELM